MCQTRDVLIRTLGLDTSEAKQVIVVRRDLYMSRGKRKGKFAAQVAHASLACILKVGEYDYNDHSDVHSFILSMGQYSPIRKWLEGAFTKIVVGVESEDELLSIKDKCVEMEVLHELITDAGKTEFDGVPTNTCVGIGPDYCSVIDLITGDLNLIL